MREQITGGLVRVSQRVKTGDYEHKDATVELTFSTPEGSDYRDIFDQTSDAADTRVREILGLVQRPKRSRTTRPPVVQSETVSVSEPEIEAKAEVVAATAEDPFETPVAGAGTTVATSSTPEDAQSAAGSTDEWTAAPREITDVMLQQACSKTCERLNRETGAQEVRKVIGQFAVAGKPSSSIPQAQRQAFLDALEALK